MQSLGDTDMDKQRLSDLANELLALEKLDERMDDLLFLKRQYKFLADRDEDTYYERQLTVQFITLYEELAKKVDKAIFPQSQGGPLMHVIAAKAIALKEATKPEFKEYQAQIVKNAKCLAFTLLSRGINLVSGGTDNHLMLLNLVGTGVTGKQLEEWMDMANITLNKNAIPNDPEKPTVTSGVRIGTITTRGMKEKEMVIIGNLIADVIEKKEDAIPEVKEKVLELTSRFPVYAEDVIY